ncbi:MAG: 50S ribosome-binding GTPase [Methylococcaceae bacterium]|nr:50S ribosome-binding GTPase [Methylococcaceae bacterium]
MRATWPWLILLLLALIPWLLLAGLGGYWLWHNGRILDWLWFAMALSGASWIAAHWLKKKQASPFSDLPAFEPNRLWSPTAERAWNRVEVIADRLEPTDYSLGEPAKLLSLAHRIVAEVARFFRPETERAELDVPLPSILLIIEKVSRDMRELLSEQVPASHLITVEDGLMLWRWKDKLEQMGAITGIGRMLVNPVGGVLHELRMAFFGRITRYPLAELERWMLHTLTRKIGYYAILLYSGQLSADLLADRPSKDSTWDLETAQRQWERPVEPLRILLVGQTKAGKSTLINALFGELRAPADVLPLTYALTPYRLEREGEFLGLVFDSPGYGDGLAWIKQLGEAVDKMDLILLVCSATQAGRAADSNFLNHVHARFAKNPQRSAPALIVALTHIDQLRPPRIWSPPYNLDQPANAKENSIRGAMEEVARNLAIPLATVQAVCLKPGEEWNVEAVWTAIAAQLPAARRAQYLRCLKDARAREKWELILRQLGNAGSVIVGGVGKLLPGK